MLRARRCPLASHLTFHFGLNLGKQLEHVVAETLRDEAFLADARKAPMPIDYITGEQVADLIRRADAAPPAVIERMRAILAVR